MSIVTTTIRRKAPKPTPTFPQKKTRVKRTPARKPARKKKPAKKKAVKKTIKKKIAKKKPIVKKSPPKKKRTPKKVVEKTHKRKGGRPITKTPEQRIAKQRATNLSIARKAARLNREIGDIPDLVDLKRRDRTKYDFHQYLMTYERKRYTLEFSKYHLWLIHAAQQAILEGMQKLGVFPRGSGKTSIFRDAVKWATLHGHRKFPILIGAEESKSRQHLNNLKRDLLLQGLSENLMEDFPEIIFPIVETEGIANRANFQICRGESTGLHWGDYIIFPTTQESLERGNAGAIVATGTITGSAVRGGLINDVRPDVALVDDPQTRASAKSPTQCQDRLDILNGDILGMAGPDKKISVLVAGTPIYRDDMIDRLSVRQDFPEWGAFKIPMLLHKPDNMDLWETWNDVRKQCFLDEARVLDPDKEFQQDLEVGSFLDPAHDFYRKHRKAMDTGAETYWKDRILPGYVSSLETAMSLYFRNPRTFASEYNVSPLDMFAGGDGFPAIHVLQSKMHNYPHRVIPHRCQHVTVGIDVQKTCLYWTICAFEPNFTGYLIDYGVYPDQKRTYYSLSDIRRTLFMVKPGSTYTGALYDGLNTLFDQIEDTPWQRADGTLLPISKALIDAQWPESTNTVFDVCHSRGVASPFTPAFGLYIRGGTKPFHKHGEVKGSLMGLQWKMPPKDPHRPTRHVTFDTNWWKTFLCGSARLALNDPGTFTLFKQDRPHQMIAEHLNSQYPAKVDVKGATYTEWHKKPSHPDDHFLLTLVYNYVAASISGVKPLGIDSTTSGALRKPRKLTRETLQRRTA